MRLTKEQISKYLNDPNYCPICNGLVKVEEDFNENSMSREVRCVNPKCGIKFQEVYDLVTIELIK